MGIKWPNIHLNKMVTAILLTTFFAKYILFDEHFCSSMRVFMKYVRENLTDLPALGLNIYLGGDLTHWGRLTQMWFSKLSHHWFKPSSESVPAYYQFNSLEQTSVKFEKNMIIFIQDNTFEDVFRKLLAIVFRPPSVSYFHLGAVN